MTKYYPRQICRKEKRQTRKEILERNRIIHSEEIADLRRKLDKSEEERKELDSVLTLALVPYTIYLGPLAISHLLKQIQLIANEDENSEINVDDLVDVDKVISDRLALIYASVSLLLPTDERTESINRFIKEFQKTLETLTS